MTCGINGSRGVFWIVDGALLAFPFEGGARYGVARSGKTYNHRLLWEHVRPDGCRKPYNWYPRGRVDFSAKGRPVIYMSPHIEPGYLPQIMKAFGITEQPIVHYDGSEHYRCCFDTDSGEEYDGK